MKNKIDYDFIEIGTSDFDTLIETSNDDTVGLSIEPIKYYLERLPNKKNVTKVQSAVSSTDGYVNVYYIEEDKIKQHNLPWWVRGSNSINHPHPFAIKVIGEELYNSLVTIEKVKTISWETLINEYNIGSIKYLKIDTEGHDHIIFKNFLDFCNKNSFPLPQKITLEYHDGVSNKIEIDKLIEGLPEYSIIKLESDITLVKSQIPRIIHQTFKDRNLPKDIEEVVTNLKKMNPTFEYRFYDDNDCIEFIKSNYDSETLELYLKINPNYGCARSDFFRYLLMYKVGGVYLDIKSSTTRPLEEVLLPTDEYLLTHWKGLDWSKELNYEFGEFQNWHIICRPNHPFLKNVIEVVKENIRNFVSGTDKQSVLETTGPIAYSRGILELLSKYKENKIDSPVREFLVEDEIGLTYMATETHHHKLYGKTYSRTEPLILKGKYKRSYVLYATKNYINVVKNAVKSIRTFSELPIIVYLLDCDIKLNFKNVITINWDSKLSENILDEIYKQSNFYIDRTDKNIYQILIQRPLIVKDALKYYSDVVAYVDSDSIATQYCDKIFDMYPQSLEYPYFVEGIYDYLHINGRGGAISRDDLSTTLEHPACELFNVNQYVRQRYRQTGYFVAGQNTLDFLDEWYWMCNHPKILNNFEFYAPYHEETIVNVLLWKYNIMDGLPYIYTNVDTENSIDELFNQNLFTGEPKDLKLWSRIPSTEEDLLFIHGEKRNLECKKILETLKSRIKSNNIEQKKMKILFLAPHLSTGGMPSFLLKRIEVLLKYYKDVEIYVVEFSNYSPAYVVQRNKIKDLLPKSHFIELGEDKMELINIIEDNDIDVVHIDEMIEGFDSFNQVPHELMVALYDNNRTWRIIETCHNVWFDPKTLKKFHPDAYAFCTPYHKEFTFRDMPSDGEVIEFPIDNKFVTREEQKKSQQKLGLSLDKSHIINVGLWTSGKNQKEGIEIARILEKSHPGFEFHFIGNQAPNFKEYWEPLMENLPSNVRVWGERDDVETFMMAADIFMFNSTWECNPLVIREASSYGLKILSRNLPQYVGMFNNYITPLTEDLHKNVELLISVFNQEVKYNIKDGESEQFAKNHYNLYKKVINKEPIKNSKMSKKVNIIQYFVNQPFLEILGESDSNYEIKFFNENNICHYSNTVKSNHWVKLNREYFTKWNAKVWEDGKLIYDETLNYKNKRVFISFESKSLGDTIAWIPYTLEFQKEHECQVIVSTYWNHLFQDVYPELEFVSPGSTVHNIHGQYNIGWFYDPNKEPEMPNTIPLQQAATNILGLPFKEIKPNISYEIKERPYNEKYITIATNSTSGCKFWTREGWQELINYLHSLGYKVINTSKENNPFKNCEKIKDTSMENTMNVIHHSEFFIGLSSGLSWLAWAMNKQVVMISNFTEPDHEFTSNCTRIINKSVCNGCWNNPNFKFDKSDYLWCPINKGTKNQFICHTSITSKMVIDSIQHLINKK